MFKVLWNKSIVKLFDKKRIIFLVIFMKLEWCIEDFNCLGFLLVFNITFFCLLKLDDGKL